MKAVVRCSGAYERLVSSCRWADTISSCTPETCFPGVKCHNLPVSGIYCGSCPAHFHGNGKTCHATATEFPTDVMTGMVHELEFWPHGRRLSLPCFSNQSPVWHKDNRSITTNDFWRIESSGELRIFNPDVSNFSGLYGCYTTDGGFLIGYNLSIAENIKIVRGPTDWSGLGHHTLQCIYTGFPQPTVYWYKDNNILAPDDYTEIHEDTLALLLLFRWQSGIYRCVVDNNITADTAMAVITVTGGPLIVKKSVVTHAMEGSSFSLHCLAAAFPELMLVWKIDGEQIVNTSNRLVYTNGTLYFQEISVIDNNIYSCIAGNGQGNVDIWRTNLTVQKPPVVYVEPKIATVSEGDDVIFSCVTPSSQSLPVSFHLSRTGEELPPNNLTIRDTYLVTEFVVKEVNRWLSGEVSCQLTGAMGQHIASAKLTVHYAPRFVYIPENMSAYPGFDTIVPWVVEALPQPDLTWYKDGEPLHTQIQHTSYNISTDGLRFTPHWQSSSGRYTVKAQNTEGILVGSAWISVIVPLNLTITKTSPSSVTVMLEDETSSWGDNIYIEFWVKTANNSPQIIPPDGTTNISQGDKQSYYTTEVIQVSGSSLSNSSISQDAGVNAGTLGPLMNPIHLYPARANLSSMCIVLITQATGANYVIGDDKKWINPYTKDEETNSRLVSEENYLMCILVVQYRHGSRLLLAGSSYISFFTRGAQDVDRQVGTVVAAVVAVVFTVVLLLLAVYCLHRYGYTHRCYLVNKLFNHSQPTSVPIGLIDVDAYLDQFSVGQKNSDTPDVNSLQPSDVTAAQELPQIAFYIPTEDEIDALERIGINYYDDEDWVGRVPESGLVMNPQNYMTASKTHQSASSTTSTDRNTSQFTRSMSDSIISMHRFQEILPFGVEGVGIIPISYKSSTSGNSQEKTSSSDKSPSLTTVGRATEREHLKHSEQSSSGFESTDSQMNMPLPSQEQGRQLSDSPMACKILYRHGIALPNVEYLTKSQTHPKMQKKRRKIRKGDLLPRQVISMKREARGQPDDDDYAADGSNSDNEFQHAKLKLYYDRGIEVHATSHSSSRVPSSPTEIISGSQSFLDGHISGDILHQKDFELNLQKVIKNVDLAEFNDVCIVNEMGHVMDKITQTDAYDSDDMDFCADHNHLEHLTNSSSAAHEYAMQLHKDSSVNNGFQHPPIGPNIPDIEELWISTMTDTTDTPSRDSPSAVSSVGPPNDSIIQEGIFTADCDTGPYLSPERSHTPQQVSPKELNQAETIFSQTHSSESSYNPIVHDQSHNGMTLVCSDIQSANPITILDSKRFKATTYLEIQPGQVTKFSVSETNQSTESAASKSAKSKRFSQSQATHPKSLISDSAEVQPCESMTSNVQTWSSSNNDSLVGPIIQTALVPSLLSKQITDEVQLESNNYTDTQLDKRKRIPVTTENTDDDEQNTYLTLYDSSNNLERFCPKCGIDHISYSDWQGKLHSEDDLNDISTVPIQYVQSTIRPRSASLSTIFLDQSQVPKFTTSCNLLELWKKNNLSVPVQFTSNTNLFSGHPTYDKEKSDKYRGLSTDDHQESITPRNIENDIFTESSDPHSEVHAQWQLSPSQPAPIHDLFQQTNISHNITDGSIVASTEATSKPEETQFSDKKDCTGVLSSMTDISSEASHRTEHKMLQMPYYHTCNHSVDSFRVISENYLSESLSGNSRENFIAIKAYDSNMENIVDENAHDSPPCTTEHRYHTTEPDKRYVTQTNLLMINTIGKEYASSNTGEPITQVEAARNNVSRSTYKKTAALAGSNIKGAGNLETMLADRHPKMEASDDFSRDGNSVSGAVENCPQKNVHMKQFVIGSMVTDRFTGKMSLNVIGSMKPSQKKPKPKKINIPNMFQK